MYFLRVSSNVTITRYVFPLSCSMIGSVFVCCSPIFLLIVVVSVLFLIYMRWPLIVSLDLGILLIYFAMIPGRVLKYPRLNAFANVSCTGMNAVACICMMKFSLKST